jgi:hypothetical protein
MRDAYKAISGATFYVRFEATDPSGYVAHGEVRYDFMAPNKLRAAFRGLPKGPALLICDGKHIAIFSSDGKQKQLPFLPGTLGAHLPSNVETLAFIDSVHELSTAKDGEMRGSQLAVRSNEDWNGRKWTVLRETNEKDSVQVDYYVDPKTLLIWRTAGQDMTTHKPFIDAAITDLDLTTKQDPKKFHIPLVDPRKH